MIITVSGAGCTGKSTLLDNLKQRNPMSMFRRDIYYHGEFIRKFFEECYHYKYETFSDLLNGDPLDIINIHKDTARYFNEVLWSSNVNDILVFDRSPLDISIYMYMNLIDHLDNPKILSEYQIASKYIYRCIQDFMNHDPIILYARPFTEIVEEDGFRPTSLLSRRNLELSLFNKEFLGLPDVHILPNNLEERISTVRSIIGSALNSYSN